MQELGVGGLLATRRRAQNAGASTDYSLADLARRLHADGSDHGA